MNMRATFIDDDGNETVYHDERAWAALIAYKTPYKGVPKMPPLISTKRLKRKRSAYKGAPQLKRIPATKRGYKVKNGAGGRKAMFTQSREYKLKCFDGCAIHWGKGSQLYEDCIEARSELVQAIGGK